MKKPNIIFYFSDQQRWDTLGCYGQTCNVTPNLDMLAAAGVRYSNTYTCQPVCGPARACLQSGKYATQTGCYVNGISLPLNTKTIAHYLSEAGYDTAYIGKWHLASDMDGVNYETAAVPKERRGGYDYWMASDVLEFTSHGYNGYVFDQNGKKVDFIGYRVDCINNFAVDYLHQKHEKPFFLFVSHIDPHHQNDHNRYEGPDGSKGKFSNYEVPGDLRGTQGDWRQNYPDYLGQCNRIDQNVGYLVDTLKEMGMWENTILFYTSDHGSHFRTRNPEYKRSCHDGCIHVPLIVHGPGFEGGKVVEDMVSLMDIPATILDCAGIKKPEDFQGNSLKKRLAGQIENWPQEIFLQISEDHVGRAIRTREWKYSIRGMNADGWKDSGSKQYIEDYLYDLQKDPHEKNNLVSDPGYKSIRKQLADRLIQRMLQAGEKEPVILPHQN